MFSLQLPKTSLRFQLADLPTWAPVDDREETITDTHAALSKLLADCKKYVGAVVASCVMVGWASMAQETPQKNNIPVGTVATQPVGKEIPGAVVEISFRVPEGRDVSQKDATSSSPSATLQATNGYWQTVDTPFGKLSFAEIQGHEKKDEIIDDVMTPEQSRAYNDWLKWKTQTANQNIQAKVQIEQTANQNIQAKVQIEQTANQNIQTLRQVEQKVNQKIIREVTLLVNRIEKNESLLRDSEIVKNLQAVYDKPEIFSSNESLFSKIQTFILKAERYHVQVGW